jgi:dTDP-4-amino-4,6-dideoxygalactose transaminase
LKLNELTKSHQQIFSELREAGIGVNLHYIPVYKQPFYKALGFNDVALPATEEYYQTAISIPIFALLTAQQQDKIISELKRVLI